MLSWLVKFIFITVLANTKAQVHGIAREISCTITQEELQQMRSTIENFYEGGNVRADNSDDCGLLISETISCAVALKAHLIGKIEQTDRKYNETYSLLAANELQFLNLLEQAPGEIKTRNREIIIQLTQKINELRQKIWELRIKQYEHQIDLQYYEDYLSNGTKFSSRFDDDEFFESAKKCEISFSDITKLISQLDEITRLLAGNSENSDPNECFSELRHRMANIENLSAHRTGDQRIKSLYSIFEERAKCFQKLNDNLMLQLTQESALKFSQISDEFQALLAEFNKLTEQNKNLRRDTRKKAVETIVRMVRSGTKMRKAVDIFLNIHEGLPKAYKIVLNMSYDCNTEHLLHTLRFTAFYRKVEGHEIVYSKMQDCEQLESPFILKIQSTLGGKDLSEHVDVVYKAWTSQLQQGDFKQIIELIQMFDEDVADLPHFFRVALKQNLSNMKHILKFIDTLSPYSQNVVKKLSDDMRKADLVDTAAFVELALWISSKMLWIKQQDAKSANTGGLGPYIEELKNEMSDSLKTFAFESELILATKNEKYLMRSDTHGSVKFITIKHPTENFYKFQDLRFEKAFYSGKCKDAKSDDNGMRVQMGNGNSDNYYWQLIPTDKTEFFYLKNKANGHFLSSKENNVCVEKAWYGSCKRHEWMNQAHANTNDASTKWLFTTRLFRDGILPDRNQG